MRKNFQVIIPANLLSSPSKNEIEVAGILARYFQKNVRIVDRGSMKTADYYIDRRFWELKAIEGDGKRTIQHALHRAAKQSENVVVDAREAKMDIRRIRSQLKLHFRYIPRLKRLLLIEKNGRVVEILK